MTIDQTNVIDFAGIDPKTDKAILFISDHLEWEGDSTSHMFLLQEKINAYLAAIESGEVYELYPKAAGRAFVIRILGMHPLSDEAKRFFEKVKSFLVDAGFNIEFRHSPSRLPDVNDNPK